MRMLTRLTWSEASAPTMATVAALMGEAISPPWDAMTLIESGRSGRMSAFAATSTMTGISA